MKFSTSKFTLLSILSLTLFLTNCKKKDDIVRIQSIVPQKIIDDLKSRGMIINEGIHPPTLQDAYVMSPWELKSPYGEEDPWEKGRVISDYYYKFYDQNEKNEIKYDYHNTGSDKGVGEGAFIAGDGKKFTIFSEESGESGDVKYKNVTIISGELSADGIKDFQLAFVLKEKIGDDDNETHIPVETGRIWIDSDFISEQTDKFRKSARISESEPSHEGFMSKAH